MANRYVKCIFASEKIAIFDCIIKRNDMYNIEANIIVKNTESLDYRAATKRIVNGFVGMLRVKGEMQEQVNILIKDCQETAKWIFSEGEFETRSKAE